MEFIGRGGPERAFGTLGQDPPGVQGKTGFAPCVLRRLSRGVEVAVSVLEEAVTEALWRRPDGASPVGDVPRSTLTRLERMGSPIGGLVPA